MNKKRFTERFPWLLPLRQSQRKLFFYMGMRRDGNQYAQQQEDTHLPCEIFQCGSLMVNENSGYDINYQYNKVYNLKLAAKKIHGLVIQPGETFSFCLAIKDADKTQSYRDGLSLVNGKITGEYGGGLCQFSNLLYWVFLHTALTITERHGHGSEAIPPTDQSFPVGVDATVAEGWLDLKVKNETSRAYQLVISFDEKNIYACILADEQEPYLYQIYNESVTYTRQGELLVEASTVNRKKTHGKSNSTENELLYRNRCIIEYPLPAGTEIK